MEHVSRVLRAFIAILFISLCSLWERAFAEPALDGTTACLAMIIKNEGPILPRLFESVKGFVSEYCIMDTGSTDDTVDVVRSMNMSGTIFQGPFVNFAHARNAMLDKCREVMTACDYFVLLDADMVLRVSADWDWNRMEHKDVYNFIQISGLEYENVRMIRRTADRIQVVGSTHEYYDVPPEYSRTTLSKELIYIEDVGDGKAKGDKFERDERLLKAELEQDPDNPRTVFYLANTLRDQGKYADAIPLYERRMNMHHGWWAEREYSIYQLSRCYLGLDDLDNGRRYGELAATVGYRAEPLYDLVFYLHRHQQYALAWYYYTLASSIAKPSVDRALFISVDIYNFWLDFERATLCPHVFLTQLTFCMEAAFMFLNNPHAPQYLREYFYRENLPQVASTHILKTDIVEHHFYNERLRTTTGGRERVASVVELQVEGPIAGISDALGICVAEWFPLFTIGQWQPSNWHQEGPMECLPDINIHAPRFFSFLESATLHGVEHNGDKWFLAKSVSRAEDREDAIFYHVVAIDSANRLKAYSYPFVFNSTALASSISNPGQRPARDVCTDLAIDISDIIIRCEYSYVSDERTAQIDVTHRLPWAELARIMVSKRP